MAVLRSAIRIYLHADVQYAQNTERYHRRLQAKLKTYPSSDRIRDYPSIIMGSDNR